MPEEWTQYEIVLFGKGWGSWAHNLQKMGVIYFPVKSESNIPVTYIEESDCLAEMTETGTVKLHKNRLALCVNDFLHMLYKRVPNTVVVEPSGYEDPTLADLAEGPGESPDRFVMIHQTPEPCEHLNTLDPMGKPNPGSWVLWCRDCGALLMPGDLVLLPGVEQGGVNGPNKNQG